MPEPKYPIEGMSQIAEQSAIEKLEPPPQDPAAERAERVKAAELKNNQAILEWQRVREGLQRKGLLSFQDLVAYTAALDNSFQATKEYFWALETYQSPMRAQAETAQLTLVDRIRPLSALFTGLGINPTTSLVPFVIGETMLLGRISDPNKPSKPESVSGAEQAILLQNSLLLHQQRR